MQTIETWIDIAAPTARVWSVLTAFDEYPGWNPFITTIAGSPRQGQKLRVQIHPPGQSPMTFKPTVMEALPEQRLAWLGHLLMPGLFDGRHQFDLTAQDGGCRFRQSEQFGGILVPLFGSKVLDATKRGFEAMNIALKQRAEA